MLFSCLFAIVFRFFWLSYGIPSVEYIFSYEYISYIAIIVLFKFIFGVVLEFLLGDKFFISIGDSIKISDIALMMDDNSKDTSSKQSSSGRSDKVSKPLGESESLATEAMMKLFFSMDSNLDNQDKMIKRLGDMKEKKKIQYFSEEGDLSINVPSSMSNEDSRKVAGEVGVIDRLLNTYFDEYKELSKKDSDSNYGAYNTLWEPRVKKINDSYKDLFEKD